MVQKGQRHTCDIPQTPLFVELGSFTKMSTSSSTFAAPLRKTTQTFAVHQIPLQCDVYDVSDYSAESPVFLFFHSGGLTAGAKTIVPPWLVQVGLNALSNIQSKYLTIDRHATKGNGL